MKYKYDKQTDIMIIELSTEKPDFAEQEGDIITHYTKENKPVEIEILNASKTTIDMLKAMLPRQAAIA
ncbi:DUF2283 domain-containing protein [Candidatus Micrarchaeota archaeon]|nr:DUF2283 domain-containing protein [Candidatus Micrarchaeota archaeon]MBU2477240.1 DUF2283 domain-containing protein [Candidatus Micrarchaeota archaeon]